MKKTFTIRIKPKLKTTTVPSSSCEMSSMYQCQIQEREEREERKVERQEECCAEIQSLRCEIETMKTEMNEMRQQMKQMLRSGYTHSDGDSHGDSRNSHYSSETSASDFGDWASGLEVTRQDLENMFEFSDVVDWASKFIVADLKQQSGHPYSLCAIKGSRNEMLTYHGGAWKKMTDQEFASTIVNKVFKKLLAAFTAWKNENYNKILTSEHFSTLYHSNYARILSFNENASKLKTKLFHALL
jgi:hypothetical protein